MMRPDQIARLQELSEQLADSFIVEAGPAEWPGTGKPPAELSQEERGNAYWCKKNAMATGGVLRYALDLLDKQSSTGPDLGAQEADMDRRIKDAEHRAAKAVERVIGKAKGTPAHGKQPG